MVDRTERWLGWVGKLFALAAILLLVMFLVLGPYRHSTVMHAIYGKTNQTAPLESEEAAVAVSGVTQAPASQEGCGCPLCCPASQNDL